jgi:nucleolar protein 53
VAKEVKKELKKELEPAAPPKTLQGPPPDIYDGLVLSEEEDDEDSEGGSSGGEEGEDAAAAARRREARKKTRADRNREKRARAADRELEERRALKRQRAELQSLKAVRAALEEEEQARELRRARRAQVRAEREAAEPPKLGRHRFAGEDLRVMTTDELTGSLRQVRQEGLLAKDRFLSLQKRGVLEVRRPETKKRKMNKRQEYTHGDRGDRALERQVELQEMLRANNAKAKAQKNGRDTDAAAAALEEAF